MTGCAILDSGIVARKNGKRLPCEVLQAENAKLRELVSILCFCMQIHKRCADCKLNGSKGELVHDPLMACRGLHAMLRELGVEVDDG